jgi:hypothetical protein
MPLTSTPPPPPPRRLVFASPVEPSGASWLINCLLELGIQVDHKPVVDKVWRNATPRPPSSHMWQTLESGALVLNPKAEELRKWLPALSRSEGFRFRDDLAVEYVQDVATPAWLQTRAIFFVRDPRDALYSMYRRRPREQSLEEFLDFLHPVTLLDRVDQWALHAASWLAHPDVSVFRFEDYKRDAEGLLGEILAQLDIAADGGAIQRAAAASSFEQARAAEARYRREHPGDREVANRAGRVGDWLGQPDTRPLARRVQRQAGELLARLGYAPAAAGVVADLAESLARVPDTGRAGVFEGTACVSRLRAFDTLAVPEPVRAAGDAATVHASVRKVTRFAEHADRASLSRAGLAASEVRQLLDSLIEFLAGDAPALAQRLAQLRESFGDRSDYQFERMRELLVHRRASMRDRSVSPGAAREGKAAAEPDRKSLSDSVPEASAELGARAQGAHDGAPPRAPARVLRGGRGAALTSPSALLEQAAGAAGVAVEEVAGTVHEDALAMLCLAFAESSLKLSFFGRKRAELALVDALVKAVRLRTYQRNQPELAELELPASIVVVAPFRSGTTFLHRLLAEDPASRWPRSWEVLLPPPPSPAYRGEERYFVDDARVAATQRFEAGFRRRHGRLAELHATDAGVAEECFGLLETTLHSHSFFMRGAGAPYLAWLEEQPAARWQEIYTRYADQLRLLHWWYPGERWVLKSPFHLWHLAALAQALPKATFVQIHRSPAACTVSFCELLQANFAAVAASPDPAWIGEQARWLMRTALARCVAQRAQLPAARFVDVAYDALTRDPIGTVREIYAGAGLALGAEAEARMRGWLEAGVSRASGGRRPSLGDYGVEAAVVERDFAAFEALGRGAGSGAGSPSP